MPKWEPRSGPPSLEAMNARQLAAPRCRIANAELRCAFFPEWLHEQPAGNERDAIGTRALAAHERLQTLRAEWNFETIP